VATEYAKSFRWWGKLCTVERICGTDNLLACHEMVQEWRKVRVVIKKMTGRFLD